MPDSAVLAARARRALRVVLASVAILLLLIITSNAWLELTEGSDDTLSSSGTGSGSKPGEYRSVASDTSSGKYTQTWSKDYAGTTCEEWSGAMTADQRFAAAADMLASARNKGDGETGVPSDGLVLAFEANVSLGCDTKIEGQSLAETAAGIYLLGRDQFRP